MWKHANANNAVKISETVNMPAIFKKKSVGPSRSLLSLSIRENMAITRAMKAITSCISTRMINIYICTHLKTILNIFSEGIYSSGISLDSSFFAPS